MKFIKSFTLSVILLFIPIFLFAEMQIDIDVSAKGKKKIPVYIVKFNIKNDNEDLKKLNNKIFNIIINDLNFSDNFKIFKNNKSSFLDFTLPNTLIKLFKNAEYVVQGETGYMLNDQIYVKLKIYDLFLKQYKLYKNFYGSKIYYRRIAHKISNNILKRLTDETSVFEDKILYVTNATGIKQIAISDYDGGGEHFLTSYKTINISPKLYGNILYFTSFRSGNPKIFIKNLKTGGVKTLISKGNFSAGADLSPNGDKIVAMFENGGDADIGIFNIKGKLLTKVTDNIFNESSPVWSHNGKYIAFVSNRSGTPQIYTYNINSKKINRLTFTSNYSSYPSWGFNDEYIYFSSKINGFFQICRVSTSLMHYEQLTFDRANHEFPTVSKNGKYLLYSKSKGNNRQLFIKSIETGKIFRVTHDNFDYSYPAWYYGDY